MSDNWLAMARDAHTQSSDWFDASMRKSVEKAMAHFANRHPPGSKYHSELYKYRSKGFRPKTRSTIRRNEAAAGTAFFSTQDVVSIEAQNEDDQGQVFSAKLLTEIVNYRLDDSIPWLLTVVGAYQDALNVGVCISHQTWQYKESVEQSGDEANPQQITHVEADKPVIDLVAVENFRISPSAKWTDPIGSTPYIIEMIPMTIGEVKERMVAGKWIKHEDGEIQTAAANQYDSIRQAREGKRTVKDDVQYATSDFDTVFVHRNIMRKDGKDYLFFTLGTTSMLTEPVRLLDAYPHLARGERPYVMGFAVLESHKPFPESLNMITSALQDDANDLKNQRGDNIALVLNRRYYAKRTATIDYKSLTRNVPGSVTLLDDINTDIRWDAPPDVTGSSYQEQDRISLDYDELAGTFSPGSVQSNRKLGETVGGMELLSGDANSITEYQLRVFANTWMEPVVKQLVKMIQAYEDDRTILMVSGSKAGMQKMGVDEVTDEMLQNSVSVRVNVGFGATNPEKRVQKIAYGLQAIAQFVPGAIARLDEEQIISEVMGAVGYKNGKRFFKPAEEQQQQAQPDPTVQAAQIRAEAQIQVEQLQAKEEADHAMAEARLEMQRQAHEAAEADKDRQLQIYLADVDAQVEQLKLSGQHKIKLDTLKAMLAEAFAKLELQRKVSMQVATPAIEPPGRAPEGQAFAK